MPKARYKSSRGRGCSVDLCRHVASASCPGCPLPCCPLPAARRPLHPARCQVELCTLRCNVGNTFWPRPKPDCAALPANWLPTCRQTDRQAHCPTLLSLSSPFPLTHSSLCLSAACIHFHLQHLLVDTLRPSASAAAAAARPKRT